MSGAATLSTFKISDSKSSLNICITSFADKKPRLKGWASDPRSHNSWATAGTQTQAQSNNYSPFLPSALPSGGQTCTARSKGPVAPSEDWACTSPSNRVSSCRLRPLGPQEPPPTEASLQVLLPLSSLLLAPLPSCLKLSASCSPACPLLPQWPLRASLLPWQVGITQGGVLDPLAYLQGLVFHESRHFSWAQGPQPHLWLLDISSVTSESNCISSSAHTGLLNIKRREKTHLGHTVYSTIRSCLFPSPGSVQLYLKHTVPGTQQSPNSANRDVLQSPAHFEIHRNPKLLMFISPTLGNKPRWLSS